MNTSKIERVLKGAIDWRSFCAMHETERVRLLSRNDGAETSGDLGLLFDSAEVIVTAEQIEKLCKALFEYEIDLYDAQFLATIIALSGFDFDSDDTEDAVLMISDSECLGEIQTAAQMLRRVD